MTNDKWLAGHVAFASSLFSRVEVKAEAEKKSFRKLWEFFEFS